VESHQIGKWTVLCCWLDLVWLIFKTGKCAFSALFYVRFEPNNAADFLSPVRVDTNYSQIFVMNIGTF